MKHAKRVSKIEARVRKGKVIYPSLMKPNVRITKANSSGHFNGIARFNAMEGSPL